MPGSIGKLERVPLRQVWPHEALDFTRWLQENVEILNDIVDLHLVDIEREQNAGTFYVDIVATDEGGSPVIIENQLEKSDHDHLGKLITYLTAIDAKTAIWIVSEPRPEHIAAITWLNESKSASFYMIRVEAVRINDSPPAPLLTKIVGPSEEGRKIGQQKEEWAERDKLRHIFWEQLLIKAKNRTNLHSNISPSRDTWISTGSGLPTGLYLVYRINMHEARIELYIDRGQERAQDNIKIFNFFNNHKDDIEEQFGKSLVWDQAEGLQACRVTYHVINKGYREPEAEWPSIQDEMINAMIKLEKAFRPFIRQMQI
jgi:hypothetical protein